MGEVARIVFHQLRDELRIAFRERHVDLASGCIFGEVAGGRQAPIQRKGLRGAGLIPSLIQQVAQGPGGERRFGGFRVGEHLAQRARRLAALAGRACDVHQAHQL